MKKRKIYLHIGTEKTGTTSIQEFLYENREALIHKGYYFIQSAGVRNNRALPSYAMRDDITDDFFQDRNINTPEEREKFREDTKLSLDQEISSLPDSIHSIIISSEHFHSRNTSSSQVNIIKNLLSPYFSDIKIICYLREQTETLSSLYSTLIKSGTIYDFSYHLKFCTPRNPYYNFETMLKNWVDNFGEDKLCVRRFDRKSFINSDLIDDFLSCLDTEPSEDFSRTKKLQNESLNPLGQVLGLTINQAFPNQLSDKTITSKKRKLLAMIDKNFAGKGVSVTPEQYSEIFEAFRETNRVVNRKYLNSEGDLFPFKEPVNNHINIDQNSILKLILQLIDFTPLPGSFADFFRDTALLYETQDLEKAFIFMELAQRIRPDGVVINKKLNEYREKLK